MPISRLSVLLAALFLAMQFSATASHAAGNATEPDASRVVAGIIKAYGGKDAIMGVKNVYATGEITAVMRDDKGTYTRYIEHDRKLRVETIYGRSSEVRIMDGDAGWRTGERGALEKVTSFRLLAMVYQYKQLDLPYGLLTNTYKVRLAGEGEVDGRHVDILALDDVEGPPMDVYVDSREFHILKVTGYMNVNGNQTDLSVEFGDFRKVGGMLQPFRITNYSGGRLIGHTTIKDCKANQKMAGSLFRP